MINQMIQCPGCLASFQDDVKFEEHRRGYHGWHPKPKSPEIVRPIIVCLCGSTRFSKVFQEANLRETLNGKIVLTIGCDLRSDTEVFGHMTIDEVVMVKDQLDRLHLRKIDMADEVLILNVEKYIGESTARELAYARSLGKRIRFLEEV